jgi:hypothetical protein
MRSGILPQRAAQVAVRAGFEKCPIAVLTCGMRDLHMSAMACKWIYCAA